MKLETKPNCPLNGFEPCKQLDCAWFLKIAGTHPNTGEQIDEWGCSMAWLPIMLIENGKQQHSTASAVESFRNEMVKANEMSTQLMIMASGIQTPKMIEVQDANDNNHK